MIYLVSLDVVFGTIRTMDAVSAPASQPLGSPRRARRMVYPFLTLLDGRLPGVRMSRQSASDAEKYGGILSDNELLDFFTPVLQSREGATNLLNMCAVRDARVVLAGIPNATVVEVGAFAGTDTALYATMAGKVRAYEAGLAKVAGINRLMDRMRVAAETHGIALADV